MDFIDCEQPSRALVHLDYVVKALNESKLFGSLPECSLEDIRGATLRSVVNLSPPQIDDTIKLSEGRTLLSEVYHLDPMEVGGKCHNTRFVFDAKKPIGDGGMSNLYLAVDRLGTVCDNNSSVKLCAAKIFSAETGNSINYNELLQREGELTQTLSKLPEVKDHIVQIYDIAAASSNLTGDSETTTIIYEELLQPDEYKTLFHENMYDYSHSNSSNRIIRIFEQLALVVDTLSKNGIYHRDLKSENIFCRESDGFVKIIDFGISTGVPKKNQIAYSKYSSSPEWAKYKLSGGNMPEPGLSSEVYSIGVMMFETLTGDAPYTFKKGEKWISPLERNVFDSKKGFRTNFANNFSSYTELFPKEKQREDLQNIFEKVFSVEPEKRHQTATEFVDEIKRVLYENDAMVKFYRKPKT